MLSDDTSRNLNRIRSVSQQGKKVQGLFRLMTHSPDIWLEAYAKIYANKGAITKGIDDNTLDGMSEDRVTNLIMLLKENRYFPAPARRTHIPKSNGQTRPLGIPRGDDKLVQEVVRRLLEAIYEPRFITTSHGFRPKRSCHTALKEIYRTWRGTTWFVDMDIQGYFENISHEKLIELLRQTIDDRKFITIIKRMLKAGYLEEWAYHRTHSGTPQGGVVSPILANVYLHELDVFMKAYAIEFGTGRRREVNPEYQSLSNQIHKLRQKIDTIGKDNPEEIKQRRREMDHLDKRRKTLPCMDLNVPYRKLRYIRYADDFLIGISGSQQDAERVAHTVQEYLKKQLLLNVAEEKSGIYHGRKGTQFLGYSIRTRTTNKVRKICHTSKITGKKSYSRTRTMTDVICLRVPREKVQKFYTEHGYAKQGIPKARGELLNNSDLEIVSQYNAELRGIANYYALTDKAQLQKVEYYALVSLFKTLAAKHKVSAKKIRSGMKQGSEHVLFYDRNGERKTLIVFKLKHRRPANVPDVDELPNIAVYGSSIELLERLNARKCEYCGKEKGYFDVHHVRKLKDIKDGKEVWQKCMIERRRKTLVLCVECHQLLHVGKLPSWRMNRNT